MPGNERVGGESSIRVDRWMTMLVFKLYLQKKQLKMCKVCYRTILN